MKMPKCIICGKSHIPKLYYDGAIFHNKEKVWECKGIVHEKCVEKARIDAQYMVDNYM
jgi:hypothetical protein